MPIYEYRCPKCERPFEVRQSVPTPYPERRCPTCHGIAFRLPTASSFVVKGFNAQNGYTK